MKEGNEVRNVTDFTDVLEVKQGNFFDKRNSVLVTTGYQTNDQYNPRKRTDTFPAPHLGQGLHTSLDSFNAEKRFHYGQQHFAPFVPWGIGNRNGVELMNLINRNSIAGQLASTVANFIMGDDDPIPMKFTGHFDEKTKKRIYEPIDDIEIEDSLNEADIFFEMSKWTQDWVHSGNYYTSFIRSKSKRKLVDINRIDPNFCRIGQLEKQNYNSFALGNFLNGYYGLDNIKYVPKLDERKHKLLSKPEAIYHGKNEMMGTVFYGNPFWIGAENHIRILNEIPIWHLANLRNQLGARFHIIVPKTYFDGLNAEGIKEVKRKIKKDIQETLSGAENSSKTFFSDGWVTAQGREKHEIQIIPIKPEIGDTAYTELHEMAMQSVCASFGINPVLASIPISNKLGTGSEVRNLYNITVNSQLTAWRKIVSRPLYFYAQANGWTKKYRDFKWKFSSYTLATTDMNKEGGESSIQ